MPVLHYRQHDARRLVALLVAMAAHVERNTPQVFPPATTDRLEAAADELLGDGPISFETRMVVVRILQAVQARQPAPARQWGQPLVDALAELDLDALRP